MVNAVLGRKNKLRLLILFSGQADSLRACCDAVDRRPDAECVLLYIRNLGFRATDQVPVEAARAVATRFLNVQTLVVADGRAFNNLFLADLPAVLSNALGLRTVCLGCQTTLWTMAAFVANGIHAEILDFPGEALGKDLAAALMLVKQNRNSPAYINFPACNNIPKGIHARVSERCALADHHLDFQELGPRDHDHLIQVVENWVDRFHGGMNPLKLDCEEIHLRACAGENSEILG